MKFDQVAHKFNCPFCNEEIMVFLDPSVAEQQYIEDCEVCCNPIEIICKFSDGKLVHFSAVASD
jgi:transcription elongation factor Elf1